MLTREVGLVGSRVDGARDPFVFEMGFHTADAPFTSTGGDLLTSHPGAPSAFRVTMATPRENVKRLSAVWDHPRLGGFLALFIGAGVATAGTLLARPWADARDNECSCRYFGYPVMGFGLLLSAVGIYALARPAETRMEMPTDRAHTSYR
jgi:hypothetical protein